MVPDELAQQWQQAYLLYGQAAEIEASSAPGDRHAAEVMAATSLPVAELWRELAGYGTLPWWAQAAVVTAAEAFEDQARRRSALAVYRDKPVPSPAPRRGRGRQAGR